MFNKNLQNANLNIEAALSNCDAEFIQDYLINDKLENKLTKIIKDIYSI